jgi:hypothetical protein
MFRSERKKTVCVRCSPDLHPGLCATGKDNPDGCSSEVPAVERPASGKERELAEKVYELTATASSENP